MAIQCDKKRNQLYDQWCPYTGAEGKIDFNEHWGKSWAKCEGLTCPKATLHRNVFGNLFIQCGGEFTYNAEHDDVASGDE